jgi:hypothetical protein
MVEVKLEVEGLREADNEALACHLINTVRSEEEHLETGEYL